MKSVLTSLLVLAAALLLLPGAAHAQQPAITIDIPLPNEIVSPEQVVAQGTGTALPENNVVVQALDAAGNILAEQAVTVVAEAGGTGQWNAVLDVNTAPGATGQIYAFSTSPADGSIVAQAAAPVSYGQPSLLPTPTQEPEPELPIAPTEAPEPELPIAPTEEPEPELPIAPTEEPEPELPIAPTPTVGATAVPPIARPAEVTIRIPLDGEQVSPVEVVVVGDGVNLPENTVVVQALDENGTVLDAQATTVDAPLGEAGEWRAILRPDVAPGVTGQIYAFARSPEDGSTLAEDAVAVQYGAPQVGPTPTPTSTPAIPDAAITIQIPVAGEIVSPAEVVVIGTGSALPENNVVVQAEDRQGTVLDQVAATVDAPLGGTGEWRAVLHPQANLGTAGRIYAFATSPKDGSILADASTQVTYGSAAPEPPSISIATPANGESADSTAGFVVGGTAVNVFENNVIVRVRDAFGRTIQQSVTTADASGNWSTGFRFLIENGTAGSIYAFATSPSDGSVTADDGVNVAFVSNCTLRTNWPTYVVRPGDTTYSIALRTGSTVGEIVLANCLPNPNAIYVGQTLYVPSQPGAGIVAPQPEITVEDPAFNGELPINTPFQATGSAVDLPLGHVTVRLLDNMGNVVDEARVDVPEPPTGAENEWLWTADLLAPDMAAGSRGTLLAYSLSPADGTIVVADSIDILFGPDDGSGFVAIADPLPYATVDLAGDEITVSGYGRGLFENNVVVQAIDTRGNILAQEPTTMKTDEIGGAGVWEVTLPLDVVTRGRLVALSPSPAEGDEAPEKEIEAAVDVYFGDPSTEGSYTVFTYPLPNTVVTNAAAFFAVAGYAGGLHSDNINVVLLDEEANLRLWMPVEVDTVSDFWSVTSPVDDAIEEDQILSVRAFAHSPIDGRITTGDRLTVVAKRADAHVTGNIVYRERIALPDDAVVTVRLVNASLADAPPEQTLEGIQVIEGPGQVPIPFAVGYNTAEINENIMYSLSVRIEDGEGNLLFINEQSVPVITNGNPTEDVEVLVEVVE